MLVDSLQPWLQAAERQRGGLWLGLGAVLVLEGGRLRFVSLFFPLLRVADLPTLAKLLEDLQDYLASVVLQPPPPPLHCHPVVWRQAQAFLGTIVMCAVDSNALLQIVLSGVAASLALGLSDAPGSFLVVRYGWRRACNQVVAVAQQNLGSAAASLALTCGSPVERQQMARIASSVVVTLADSWISSRCSWVVTAVSNCVLGAELLRLAVRDALPPSSFPSAPRLLLLCIGDVAIVGFGLFGLLRQVQRRHANGARLLTVRTLPRQCSPIEGVAGLRDAGVS